MNFSRYKIIVFKLLLLNMLLLNDLYKPNHSISKDNNNKPSADYIRNIPDSSFYILGPGDVLKIEVSEDAVDLNKTITINGEGIANLKRLKRIYAAGLTIEELTEILNKEYSAYLNDPDVDISIVQYRPVKIYIDGEVEEPGLHVLPGPFSSLTTQLNFESTKDEIAINPNESNARRIASGNNIYFPSLIDAIRKSGGVTMYADLTNIKVNRVNSISRGGGKLERQVNLIRTLDLKDNSQNIRIFDGDTIFISKNNKPSISQISKATKSNLNPKFFKVYVGGRVEKQGIVTVSKNAVLTEAIAISGGAKVLRGPIRFVRYNNDGSIERRKFNLNDSARRGSYRNPYLKNGDIIFVGKSLLNVTNEVIGEITDPIQGLFSSYGFYKLIIED